jgi:surfactin synthase thioesterase subunit
LIAELPGHNNNSKQTNYSLEQFTKKIFLFIKKKNMKNIIFFTHSVGGIIPILLAKKYLKKKLFKKFINYEGNLTHYDTLTVTKKTSLYKKK